jgi:hypothetical protein
VVRVGFPSERARKFALKYSVRIRCGAARATPGDPERVKNRTSLLIEIGNAEGGTRTPTYCDRQPLKLKPVNADQSRPRKNRGWLSLVVLDQGLLKPSAAVWLANSSEGFGSRLPLARGLWLNA